MKHRRILAILLILAMLMMAGACGAKTDSSPAAASAATPDSTEASEPEAPEADSAAAPAASEAESAVEASSAEEETQLTIAYPLEGDPHFTMMACRNNITAEAFANGGYEITPVYEAISEATGVTFDFELLAEQSYSEQLNLRFVSGDLPDVISGNIGQYDNNQLGAIEDDVLMDISPFLAENAPDYERFLEKYPEVEAAAFNSDGTTSCFKSSGYPYKSKGLTVRQDWLDQVGMTAPTNLDEVTEVLRAFHSEIGATMPLLVTSDLGSGLEPYFNTSFAGFRSLSYMLTGENSGEVVCSFASEGFINYLDYLHQLYEEGLVSNDFLTTGRDYGNYESAYLSGESGIWDDSSMQFSEAMLSRGEEGFDPEPFVLSEPIHVSDISAYDFMAGCNYITTKCSDPESAVRFFNYCYTEPGQLLYNFGVEGVSYEYDENGDIVYTELMTNNPNGWALYLAKAFYTGMWLCGEGMYRPVELNNDEASMAAIELWTDNAGDKTMTIPSGVSLDVDETSEFNTLAGDVLTSFTENTVKVVVGDMTVQDYRDMIEQLNSTGLARMTEIYQAAYDRWAESEA